MNNDLMVRIKVTPDLLTSVRSCDCLACLKIREAGIEQVIKDIFEE